MIPCLVTVLDVIIFGEKIYWELFWIRFHINFSYNPPKKKPRRRSVGVKNEASLTHPQAVRAEFAIFRGWVTFRRFHFGMLPTKCSQ